MKNIFILLSILLGQPMFCQAQRLGDFLNNLVAPLDKTEITSNFLWDQGLNGFAEPVIFDGIIRDSICLQPTTFGFLYVQARNAYVGTGPNPLPHPDVYMDYVNRYTGTDTIPMAALALRYHRILQNAVDSNLLTLQNEQLFDVQGRTQSPYGQDTLFAFVPLKSNAWQTTVHFTLPTELVWQNLGWSSPLLQADFGDGQGWQTLAAGQTYTIEYDSGGVKNIMTRIQQGSTRLEGQSIILVADEPAEDRDGGPNYPALPNDTIRIIDSNDIRIYYGSPCNRLLKPFIIVEGFELANDPERFGSRLRDLLSTDNVITGSSLKFGEWLFSQGYDVVWVNLFDIQDRIQNNADILKAALQRINQIKAANGSSEPNMIMGVSAGGIITKYMLAKTNTVPFDHQCEKFFSYDAPLRGANIPLSVQCLLQHVNYIGTANGLDLFSSNELAGAAFKGLTSHFARQTLLYRFSYENGNQVLSSQEHDDFMAEMDALGAVPIRHIALSNGSIDDNMRENITEGSHLFNVKTEGDLLTIGFPFPTIYYIQVELEANGYALSNDPNSLVYDGNFKVKLNSVPIKQYPLNVKNGRDKAYDTAPGGSSTLALSSLAGLDGMIVEDIGIPYLPVLDRWVTMSNLSVTTYATHYCFIPTASAISAGSDAPLNGPLSCGDGSANRCSMSTEATPLPGDYGVSTPEVNQDHVFLDARIGDIIAEEVDASNLIPGGLLPDNLNAYYNIGLPVQSGIPTITISTGNGRLTVNNTGKVAYATGNEPVSPLNQLRAYTKCNAVITVENGAKLSIGADAGVKDGILNVNSGSTVHIKSGGILHITSEQSMLHIKSGAQLILDPGAIVRLESSGANIRIEGDLVVNGDINFQGLGFFDFGTGNRLVFGPGYKTFNLSGAGKDKRFVRLSADVIVNNANRLHWSNGLVEVGGTLLISQGAGLNFNLMTLQGLGVGTYSAVDALESGTMNFQGCEILNLADAITGRRGLGCTVNSCTFSNNTAWGVYWTDAFEVSVRNSMFNGTNSGMALFMENLFRLEVKNSFISGHLSPIQGVINDDKLMIATPAINLYNVFVCLLNNSHFSGNTVAVKAADPLGEVTSSVIAYGGTSFLNNDAAIFVNGTATGGVVLADCTVFQDNLNGIRGRDITLMIDSWNTKNTIFDTDSPNRFIRDNVPQGGMTAGHVRICYEQKAAGGSNLMRNNFWGISNASGTPGNDPTPLNFLSLLDANCSGVVAVPQLAPFSSKNPICTADERPPSFEDAFPGSECSVSVSEGGVSTASVHEQFHFGAFLLKADSVQEAVEVLRPVAALWQADLSGFPENCQQYIQVAKALVDGSDNSLPDGDLPRPGGDRTQKVSSDQLLIAPNPAYGSTLVYLSEASSQLSVWDANGTLMHQAIPGETATYRIEMGGWKPGIYLVRSINVDGRIRTGKIVLH